MANLKLSLIEVLSVRWQKKEMSLQSGTKAVYPINVRMDFLGRFSHICICL